MRLIEKVWFKSHPAQWLLVPVLLPLTLIFTLLTALRRRFYCWNVFSSYSIDKPVIVVGNIGIGGNGKTPVVIYLLEQCQKMGLTPGVISRGYGGKAPNYPYEVDATSTADEAGDEPVLVFNRCGVPVVVGADRVASAKLLVSKGCDVIIADDGLQHYRLKRDLELVVVDANRRFGNGLLLPAGPLREGRWRLKCSDFVIVNGKSINQTTASDLLAPSLVEHQIAMNLAPSYVCNLLTKEKVMLADFIGKNVLVNALAGIGDPQRFFTTLTSQHFVLNKTQDFVDHHQFTLTDFDHFSDDLALLMTEKDAVKCGGFAKLNWWYLPVNAEFIPAQIQPLLDNIARLALKEQH